MARFFPYGIAMPWHDLPTVVIKKKLPILDFYKQNCTIMGNLPTSCACFSTEREDPLFKEDREDEDCKERGKSRKKSETEKPIINCTNLNS